MGLRTVLGGVLVGALALAACGLDVTGLGSSSVSPDGSTGTSESNGTSGSNSGTSGSNIDPNIDAGGDTGTQPIGCGVDPTPPGPASPCPSQCNGGCANGTCLIRCNTGECKDGNGGKNLVCPPSYACRIECNGVDACDGTPITCPATYACTVVCSGGNDACGSLQVGCGTASSCSVSCGNDVCSGMTIECGTGKCSATCNGLPKPTLTPNNSCGATGCP